MNIITERLTIRPFIKEDFSDTFSIYSDKKTCEYLLHEPWNKMNAEEFFARKLANQSLEQNKIINLACLNEGQVIGDISIWYTSVEETVEIGFVFSSQLKGSGFAYEATREVIKHLFHNENTHRIQAHLDADNIASSNLCKKLGMRKEGLLIKAFFRKDSWVDTLIYGMLEEDLTKEK